ncbi:MAG: 3'(2'),5'-bisphosphate nucleotidase CysQ [Alphaproteobacteria bacterium]
MSASADTAITPGLLDAVEALAREAGEAIMSYYRNNVAIDRKDDHSPVTDADRDADAIIAAGLRKLTPDIPVVTEEEVAEGLAPTRVGKRFWLVDPLDGTREFINDRDEFTVNIALIDDGAPVLGVVGVPAQGTLYAAILPHGGPGRATMCDDGGAHRPIAARVPPAEGIAVAASRSHANKDELEAYLKDKIVTDFLAAGSSLKFCLVAEGKADLYPRLGPTMEWDTAAAHAVLAAAGGHVRTLDGKELTYGKPDFRNPHFAATGRDT